MFRNFFDYLQFKHWQKIHTLSGSAIQKWQRKRLNEIVRYARRNVPVCAELWNNLGTESNLPVALETLPIVNKHTFINRPAEEYVDNSRQIFSKWQITSGTSGKPFRFLLGNRQLSSRYGDFLAYRFLWWRGIRFSDIQKKLKVALIKVRGSTGRSNRLYIHVSDFLNAPHNALLLLREFKPEIIASYPSMLLELCRALRANASAGTMKFQYAVSFGEVLTLPQRKYIEETLGCEIYDRYGTEELGVIGMECRFHNGFHLNSESFILEIVDENGERVSAGGRGRVLITDLYNYNMPFIRYDTEDEGRIAENRCPCGLATPRLFIKGRYSRFLAFGGRKIHHLELDDALDDFDNAVLRYQVVKISNAAMKIILIPGPSFENATAEEIKKRMEQLIGNDIDVSVELTDRMLYTPAGKCRIVIDATEDS